MEYMDNNNYLGFEENYEGRILIATPALHGTRFEKAIIYVFAHDENGASGVIVNHEVGRLSSADILSANQEIGGVASHFKNEKCKENSDYSVMDGGPVYEDSFLILSMDRKQEKEFKECPRLTVLVDIKDFLLNAVNGKEKSKFLIFKGITAWEGGQLEREVSDNSWVVADVTKEILFSKRIKNKWNYVVKQIGLSNNFNNIVSYHGCA